MPLERIEISPRVKWTEISIEAGAGRATRGFSIQLAEPDAALSGDWPLAPGDKVSISAGGDLLLNGFVDDYAPFYGTNDHGATVTGRSSSKDIVDCSAVHESGEFKNKKIDEIARDLLRPFGLSVESDLDDSRPIPIWRLVPGATVFDEIETISRHVGALIIGMPDGGIKITRADRFGMHSGSLVEGVNIKSASARLTEKGRHSDIRVRGQKNAGSGEKAQRLEHVAKDKTVSRYRPKIVIAEGDIDDERIKVNADWRQRRAAGLSTTAEVSVGSWRDESGELWSPEKLVYVASPRLKISQVMAINHMRLHQTIHSGTTAALSLVDPRALGAKSAYGDSNNAWSVGEEEGL